MKIKCTLLCSLLPRLTVYSCFLRQIYRCITEQQTNFLYFGLHLRDGGNVDCSNIAELNTTT